jgi:hypothetical protein
MAKLLLLSCVIAIIAIPMVTARVKSPRRGLQLTVILITIFNLLYVFAIRFIYPHLV